MIKQHSEMEAIVSCIKNGKPEDMELPEWNKYCKWARERAKELRRKHEN